jgi:site-specific recombinase XerD
MFCIIALEHYLGYRKDFVHPIIGERNIDDIQMQRACNKASESAIKWVRMAFKDINDEIIRENVEKGLHQPLIECEKVVMYTARHSLANHLLNSPNVSVRELASILSRSPNTISTYIHQLTKDNEIANVTKNMPI